MDDPTAVGAAERIGDLHSAVERLVERQRPSAQSFRQRLSLEELHDEEVHAVVRSDVVQRADVRMIERGGRPRLVLEAPATLGVRGEPGRQDLDRDGAAKTRVARLVDFAHAAAAGRRDEFVRSEPRAGGKHAPLGRDAVARGRFEELARL